MNDDDLIRELRAAARRSEDAPTGTDLDAPLGELFEARVAARIGAAQGKARPRRAWLLVAPPLAIAAAVALWFTRQGAVSSAPLPEYAMEVSGGQDSSRGEDHTPRASVVVRADGSLTLLLRPASDVTGALDVHAFAATAAAIREAPVHARTSQSGSVEVEGRVADLVGPQDATLIVVIARAGSAVDVQAIAAGSKAPPADVKVARVNVHVAK